MKPEDKFGRRLYGETWDRIFRYGTQLLERGYVESSKTPNLFLRIYPSVRFQASLTSSAQIAIWEDPRPLFYWHLARNVDSVRAARAVSIEAARLDPIPIRLPTVVLGDMGDLLPAIDQRLFNRPQPARVPPAELAGATPPTPRAHLWIAIDERSGEVLSASARAAAVIRKLRCPNCSAPVRRRWDPQGSLFYFDHLGSCEVATIDEPPTG